MLKLFSVFSFYIPKYSFLIILLLLPKSIFPESYAGHRLDDRNYFRGGGKSLINAGRIESTLPINTEQFQDTQEEVKNEFTTKKYIAPKFYSQKGGDKDDLAGRYANQVNFIPEIVDYHKTVKSKSMILFSPIASYREDFVLKRNINRLLDMELIAARKIERKNYSLNVEGGRGFQRLDGYGVLFNGIANYAETNFNWKPLEIKISLVALSYNYEQNNFTIRDNNTNDKLLGGNILFQSIPYLICLQLFHYHVNEPMQIAEKQNLQEDKKFKPKGVFTYNGFELKTKEFLQFMQYELGFFSVKGYRNYAEYSYQNYNNISSTKGFLSYFVLNAQLNRWLLRTGGLYATGDKSSSINRVHNGYSSLISDIRIFGGKSSFLLMETVNSKNGTIFKEFDSTTENLYDTKGMEFGSIGLSYFFAQNFQITAILNHANSNLGIGNEGILSAMYLFSDSIKRRSGFILLSACLARVNPVTQKKILYDEYRVDPAIKEFTRFYLSGGITF